MSTVAEFCRVVIAPVATTLLFMMQCASPGLARSTPVDVALVLAIDTSGSVDRRELAFQIAGTAAAVSDPEVAEAFLSGPHGQGAIAFVIWGDASGPHYASEWFIIRSAADLTGFSRVLANNKVRVSGSTGIGAGIHGALALFDKADFIAERKVVDISGDGKETVMPKRKTGTSLQSARFKAEAAGVVINCLAILSDEPKLGEWFAAHVVTGPGHFVMSARRFEDIVTAMKTKLIRELRHEPMIAALSWPSNPTGATTPR